MYEDHKELLDKKRCNVAETNKVDLSNPKIKVEGHNLGEGKGGERKKKEDNIKPLKNLHQRGIK